MAKKTSIVKCNFFIAETLTNYFNKTVEETGRNEHFVLIRLIDISTCEILTHFLLRNGMKWYLFNWASNSLQKIWRNHYNVAFFSSVPLGKWVFLV